MTYTQKITFSIPQTLTSTENLLLQTSLIENPLKSQLKVFRVHSLSSLVLFCLLFMTKFGVF